ncbi:MAG: hypothetical protein V3W11_02410 [bacterium]
MKKLLPILGMVSFLIAVACEETYKPIGPRPLPPPAPTSPANVLKNVEISFNQRNIDTLKRVLSPNFVFYFNPREIGRPRPEGTPYRLPSSYSFTEFWHIAYNMFKTAYSIYLSIPTGRVGEPEPEENTYRADNIDLALLVMVDELNGYIADKGYCNFEFESYPTKEGKKYWRLTNWWDRTAAVNGKSNGVKPSSLGRILAMYR